MATTVEITTRASEGFNSSKGLMVNLIRFRDMLGDLGFQRRKDLQKLVNLEGKWYYCANHADEWVYYLNGGGKELIRFRFNLKGTFIDQRIICLPFLELPSLVTKGCGPLE